MKKTLRKPLKVLVCIAAAVILLCISAYVLNFARYSTDPIRKSDDGVWISDDGSVILETVKNGTGVASVKTADGVRFFRFGIDYKHDYLLQDIDSLYLRYFAENGDETGYRILFLMKNKVYMKNMTDNKKMTFTNRSSEKVMIAQTDTFNVYTDGNNGFICDVFNADGKTVYSYKSAHPTAADMIDDKTVCIMSFAGSEYDEPQHDALYTFVDVLSGAVSKSMSGVICADSRYAAYYESGYTDGTTEVYVSPLFSDEITGHCTAECSTENFDINLITSFSDNSFDFKVYGISGSIPLN